MKAAQKTIEAELAAGGAGEFARGRYVEAVRRYFLGFEREARAQLRDVDKRLVHANQVHFNLAAERGVVVKRIEATQGVLKEIEDGAGSARG